MYVKIFAGILESSIASDTVLRRFFMDLLLIADQDGNVIATRDAIAKRLGTTRDEVDWGLAKLMEPDPESGNPDNDGRRLEQLEGRGYGWRILNYGFYRDIKTASELRAANAKRQAEFRKRNAGNNDVTLRNESNHSDSISASDSDSNSKAKEQEPRESKDDKESSLAGLTCKAIVNAGIQANPSHPDLLAALAEGTTLQQFADAAAECKAKGKGFAYLLKMVRNRNAEAAAPVAAPKTPKPACHEPAKSEARHLTAEQREENRKRLAALLPGLTT